MRTAGNVTAPAEVGPERLAQAESSGAVRADGNRLGSLPVRVVDLPEVGN